MGVIFTKEELQVLVGPPRQRVSWDNSEQLRAILRGRASNSQPSVADMDGIVLHSESC
jgi:hypothetical protein